MVDPVQVNLRPKGLGLGADASALNKAKNKKPGEEKLQLVKGAYVRINRGKEEGFYGEVSTIFFVISITNEIEFFIMLSL